MYLTLIITFGFLALLIAIPLGGQGAYGLALFIANKLNFNLLRYRIVPMALLVQAIGGYTGSIDRRTGTCHQRIAHYSTACPERRSGRRPESGIGWRRERLHWFDWMQVKCHPSPCRSAESISRVPLSFPSGIHSAERSSGANICSRSRWAARSLLPCSMCVLRCMITLGRLGNISLPMCRLILIRPIAWMKSNRRWRQ